MLFLLGGGIWVIFAIFMFIHSAIIQVNLLIGYLWLFLIFFCLLCWVFLSFYPEIFGKSIIKMELDDDPKIQKQMQWIVNIPIAIFFGFNLFLLFFIINEKYAGEEYNINCYPQDAWVNRSGKTSINLIGEAVSNGKSYFFNTSSFHRFNWNFVSIKDAEHYKGNSCDKYDNRFLVDYFMDCNSIELEVKDGFFGIEIIENGVCNPKISLN